MRRPEARVRGGGEVCVKLSQARAQLLWPRLLRPRSAEGVKESESVANTSGCHRGRKLRAGARFEGHLLMEHAQYRRRCTEATDALE